MKPNFFHKAILIIVVIILILLGSLFYTINKYKNSIFILSEQQVAEFLSNSHHCKSLEACDLRPGDILLRRHITHKTYALEKITDIYFTHAAYYLGENKIVEATGKEKNPDDEILISEISEKEWFGDTEQLVIIRAKNFSDSEKSAVGALLTIVANDNTYTFGIHTKHNKKFSCADLIFKPLHEKEIFRVDKPPHFITPDYLFYLSMQQPNQFTIIRHSERNTKSRR